MPAFRWVGATLVVLLFSCLIFHLLFELGALQRLTSFRQATSSSSSSISSDHEPLQSSIDAFHASCKFTEYVGEQCVVAPKYLRLLMQKAEMDLNICDSRARKKAEPGAKCDKRSPIAYMRQQRGCVMWENGTYECVQKLRMRGPFGENTTQLRRRLLGKRIFMVGDSMMRNLFSTLVFGLRGSPIGIDLPSTHGLFIMKNATDAYMPLIQEKDHNKFSSEESSLRASFVWAPTWIGEQRDVLWRLIHASKTAIDFVIISLACMWDLSSTYGSHFKDIETILNKLLCSRTKVKACIRRFFILTCPTPRIYEKTSRAIVAKRNTNMRTWAQNWKASQTGRSIFVDFDDVGRTKDATGARDLNWHYQCFVEPPYKLWHGRDLNNAIFRKLCIYVREDGGCSIVDKNPNLRLLRHMLSHMV